MDLKELEYILAIAEEGSISKASHRLFMAQSSLSQALSQYEAELGVRLFVRSSSGIRPTIAGEQFILNARQILRHYQRMKAEIRDSSRSLSGRIEFGVSTFRGSALMPYVLRRFYQENPDVEVIMHEHDSHILIKKIAAGDLDMALTALLPEQARPGHAPVMRDEILIVTHREHPVMKLVHARGNSCECPWIDLGEAAEFTFLLSDRFTVLGEMAARKFEQLSVAPRMTGGYLTAYFAEALARQGLGLAFTYRSCRVKDKDAVYLRLGPDGCFVDLALLYPSDGYKSLACQAFECTIRQYIEQIL